MSTIEYAKTLRAAQDRALRRDVRRLRRQAKFNPELRLHLAQIRSLRRSRREVA